MDFNMNDEDLQTQQCPMSGKKLDIEHFDPVSFARSLLPTLPKDITIKEAESVSSRYLSKNVESDIEVEPEKSVDDANIATQIDKLRVWSKIAFRYEIPPIVVPEEANEKEAANEFHDEENEKADDTYTEQLAKQFLYEEDNFKSSPIQNDCNQKCNFMPLIKSSNKKIFRFYYLDAVQGFQANQSVVYLFGKTYCPQSKSYKSCCVAVHHLKRKLFILPRDTYFQSQPDIELATKQTHLIQEFYDAVLKPKKINRYNLKFTMKKNLGDLFFDSKEHMFLEMTYSVQYPSIDADVEGETFSKVFYSKTDYFENFMLDKGLKGPCWIDILHPSLLETSKTWCFFEISCSEDDIYLTNPSLNLSPPPLTLLSMYIKSTPVSGQNHEISLISWAVTAKYDMWKHSAASDIQHCYCAFISGRAESLPVVVNAFKRTIVTEMESEISLLNYFLSVFHQIDPDILVTFDFQGQNILKLVDRSLSLKIMDVSKLGRFKNMSDKKESAFNGRMICDMKSLIKELISPKNLELELLYKQFLEISYKNPNNALFTKNIIIMSTKEVVNIIALSTYEAIYQLQLAFKTRIISLSVKLTSICGNILSQTFSKGVLKRSEYVLLHALHEKGYIISTRNYNKKDKMDEELVGGLVLEPKTGFYDNFVLVVDFNSLYPNIIREYNLCITHPDLNTQNYTGMPLGVLPSLMDALIKKRYSIKNQMNNMNKNSDSYFLSNIYQLALKLSSNGIYGCLASPMFRFYSPLIAQEITKRGRNVLQSSVQLLQKKGFEIIYGDTDSLMINTYLKDYTSVYNSGIYVTKVLSDTFFNINLKIDAIFKCLLIVSKKKYAGIVCIKQSDQQLTYETVIKGLDIMRNDLPLYVCEKGKLVIDAILSNMPIDKKVFKIKEILEKIKDDFIKKKIPKHLLLITKSLSKDPEDFSSENKYPHVEVALRCNENSMCHFKNGSQVPYLMCCDKLTSSRKAYHLREIANLPSVDIDDVYYLHKIIYPLMSRICAPLQKNYVRANIENILELPRTRKAAYKQNALKTSKPMFGSRDCFVFCCPTCKEQNTFKYKHSSLTICENSKCASDSWKHIGVFKNQLIIALRKYIKQYYLYEMICEDEDCAFIFRRVPMKFFDQDQSCPICTIGRMQRRYSEIDLFLQIEYFKNLFDHHTTPGGAGFADYVLPVIKKFRDCSAFRTVNLTNLFINS